MCGGSQSKVKHIKIIRVDGSVITADMKEIWSATEKYDVKSMYFTLAIRCLPGII